MKRWMIWGLLVVLTASTFASQADAAWRRRAARRGCGSCSTASTCSNGRCS
ncbi:MAG: hypothetical protein JSS27_02890 [Planctomycetes bacterium]|nr:hypothetical protein [Planctomycetota bacterium]